MRAPHLVLCCVLAPLLVEAQTVTLEGIVRGTSDSAALTRAHVTVRESHLATQTDDEGRFIIAGVPRGSAVQVQIRRLGYRAVDTTMTLLSDSSLTAWLRPVPRRLAEVEVRGKRIMIPAHMREIIERANRNNGTLITAADIERSFPQDTKSLFYGIAGIHVTTTTIRFIRCEDPANNPGTPFTSGPKVHVYVNGSRHTVTGSAYEAREVVQSIHPKDIEMIEIYGGVTRIPAEFLADACAVIAIWTKAY
jgi:hypothetical protein